MLILTLKSLFAAEGEIFKCNQITQFVACLCCILYELNIKNECIISSREQVLYTMGLLTSLDNSSGGTGKQETNRLLHYSASSFHLFFHTSLRVQTTSLIEPHPSMFSSSASLCIIRPEFHLPLIALVPSPSSSPTFLHMTVPFPFVPSEAELRKHVNKICEQEKV